MNTKLGFGRSICMAILICAVHPVMLTARETSLNLSQRAEREVFRYLLPAVYSSGKAVRLYYSSNCKTTTDSANDAIPFPFVKVRPPATDKSGLAAVRDIFEEDKNVKVTEEAGIIKIRIGKVPMAILGTKLPQLSLRPIQQYNPDEVFNAILDTKQMQQAMDSLRFRSVENLSSTRGDTDPRYPHLPAKLQQMTTDQLLDQVSRTWAGYLVVVYGACSGPAESGEGRLFWVGWTGQIVPKSFHR